MSEDQQSLFGNEADGSAEVVTETAAPKVRGRSRVVAAGASVPVGAVTVPAAERKFRIILQDTDGIPPTGQFVGVNGRSYVIVPNEEVVVPESVVEALKDAVSAVPVTDSNGNVSGYRDRLRLPFSILGEE